jgi:acid phosphatase
MWKSLKLLVFVTILISFSASFSWLMASATKFHAPSTPIRHLIVIVGENRSFDSLFATYVPVKGQKAHNLLSEGIVNTDGSPGPNFTKAQQWQASESGSYSIAPTRISPFATLPQPNTTFAFGRKLNEPDSRFPSNLPNGPFQITGYTAYQLSYTGDPVHRFFQMWQQFDGGRDDLFTWVATTIGTGSEGKAPPDPLTDQSTHQGGVAMGFYNMSRGDAPVFRFIADHFAISDNFHQGIMGGTGASFIYLGAGDVAFYSDGDGHAVVPPERLIEDPNPWVGSANWYKRDGYQSGSYVNCADSAQPGVAPILNYLRAHRVPSRCEPDHYYLVNNYGPAYDADGTLVDVKQHPYTLPPQTLPNIVEALSNAGVSWKYYIGGLGQGKPNDAWCSICNPLQYSKTVMTTALRANIRDVSAFFRDVASGNLPAVSFVRPYEPYSGHPGNSSVSAYEYFVLSIVNRLISQPTTFATSAIMVTFDEGGGYYDSGYIQPLDFFGDGTRTPLLVISPYVKAGMIDHAYSDPGSILKFIEANWGLKPLSSRSRDNLPNPRASENPYIPTNGPAIGDLMGIFDFAHKRTKVPLVVAGGV